MPGMIVVFTVTGGLDPSVEVDGAPLDHRDVRWVDHEEMPFAGVYIAGEPQYDTEVWVDGVLTHVVPPRSDATVEVYERIERSEPQPPLGPFPLSPDQASTAREAVEREMAAHPGRRAHDEWEGLRRMATVHTRNASEFLGVLNALGEDPVLAMEMVQNVRPPEVRDAVTGEIDQRLHNYVASTVSLIDQTRRLMDRYSNSSMRAEYERRKNDVIAKPVVGFVGDLRNYALHRALPVIDHSVSFTANREFRSQVQLSTSALYHWDGWKSVAKCYLEDAGEAVELREAVTDHVAVIEETWEWVFAQHRGLHRADIVGCNELVNEYNWLLSGGAQGRPRRTWAMLAAPSTEADGIEDG